MFYCYNPDWAGPKPLAKSGFREEETQRFPYLVQKDGTIAERPAHILGQW
jgi:hypothetical protein